MRAAVLTSWRGPLEITDMAAPGKRMILRDGDPQGFDKERMLQAVRVVFGR